MRHSNAYTFKFAAMVTIVCSVLLAGAATLLKPRQVANELLDKKKNILSSVGITGEQSDLSREQIKEIYEEKIKELVIDEGGNIVEGKRPIDIDPKKDKNLYPVYESMEDGQITSYIIPISGKGLWSTIYGYLALKPDLNTVQGITFYKHGETPGLGGEIDKEWFTDNYKGKKIRDENGNLVSVDIIKGDVEEKYPEDEAVHYVDGISGATITCRGINEFLGKDLKTYEPFFQKVR